MEVEIIDLSCCMEAEIIDLSCCMEAEIIDLSCPDLHVNAALIAAIRYYM